MGSLVWSGLQYTHPCHNEIETVVQSIPEVEERSREPHELLDVDLMRCFPASFSEICGVVLNDIHRDPTLRYARPKLARYFP
jgi:hypothetical protein